MHALSPDPEFIVYSSHKTGTQTLVHSLRANGHKAIHFHSVLNLDITIDKFREYLIYYINKYGNKVKIISSFRLPIERHISSLFQWYGTGVWRQHLPDYTNEETIIHQVDIKGLNSLLITEIAGRKLVGYEDSLHELCQVLKIDSLDLKKEPYNAPYKIDHELAEITLVKFTDLNTDSIKKICSISGAMIHDVHEANLSSRKWYSSKYEKFKASVIIPEKLIQQTYLDRKDLIEVFYPGLFNQLLEADCSTYSHLRSNS